MLTIRIADLVGSRGNDWHLLTAGAFVSMILPLDRAFSRSSAISCAVCWPVRSRDNLSQIVEADGMTDVHLLSAGVRKSAPLSALIPGEAVMSKKNKRKRAQA